MGMRFEQVTDSIRVAVEPVYLDDQSDPDENYFVWAYKVRIDNEGPSTVQLRTRYWQITDALGRVQEVRGEGVVGEQPVLKPGSRYEYTSGAPLSTPSGMMVGVYTMETSEGNLIDVAIPAFSLDSPHETVRLN